MNKKMGIFAAVMGVYVASFSTAIAVPENTKVRIERAAGVFMGAADPSMTKAQILSSLLELLDVVTSLTPESQYKTDILYRIDVAEDIFKKESIFDEKARQYLSFAYRQMTGGKKYEKPKELDEFVTPAEAQKKAQEYARKLVGDAIGQLEAGNPGETAKHLLELVLMIVTPISG